MPLAANDPRPILPAPIIIPGRAEPRAAVAGPSPPPTTQGGYVPEL